MRALRAALAALAVLMALLLAAAWFGPAMLDWGRYRVAIAALASTALGRPVRIDGDVTLRLLPEPTLTASRISVQALADAGALSARELRLRVALGPLLAGRVDARELVLDQPDLRLAWPLAAPPASDPLSGRPRWLLHAAARIEDGRLAIGGLTMTGVTASFATDPDTGALQASGEATVFDLPWRFTVGLGRPGADGVMTLQATMDGRGAARDTGGRFSGQLAADGSLAGQISGRGPDLSRVLPAPAVPWRADGRLTVSGGLAAADELALQIAGSPAHGAVALRLAPMPRLDLALAASRLDLDAWLPVLLHGSSSGLATGIDLSAEAATLGGGTLRALRGAFDLGPGGVVVRDAAAILPGEASLQLSGAMPDAAADGRPAAAPPPPFQGRAVLTLPDLRGTLRWLGAGNPGLPAGVLRTGALSAAVTLTRQSATLTDVAGNVDGTGFAGQFRIGFGEHPSLAAALRLERVELESWLSGSTPGLADLTRLAAGPEAQLHLQVAQASWQGVRADDVTLDAATAGGMLTVRRLAGTVEGLHVGMSAAVTDAGRIGDARLDLRADQSDALARLLRHVAGEGVAVPARLFRGPVRILAQASGPPQELGGHAQIDLGDAEAIVDPRIDLTTGAWSAAASLRHPGAPRLLDQLGLAHAASWLGEGSLSLTSQWSGGSGGIAVDRFDLTAGGMRAGGHLRLEQGTGAPRLTGRLIADTLPLPLPGDGPLPFHLLRGWRADVQVEAAQVLGDGVALLTQASAECSLEDGGLRVRHVSARLGPGTLAAEFGINAAAEPPGVAARGQVTGATAGAGLLDGPIDLRGGRLDAKFDLQARGYGVAALLSTLAGSTTLAATDGRLLGFDAAAAAAPLASLSAVRAALAGGSTAFTRLDLSASLAEGVLTLGSGSLTLPDAKAGVSGSVDLTAPSIDLLATVQPTLQGGAPVRLRLIGPLTNPAHVADLSARSP